MRDFNVFCEKSEKIEDLLLVQKESVKRLEYGAEDFGKD